MPLLEMNEAGACARVRARVLACACDRGRWGDVADESSLTERERESRERERVGDVADESSRWGDVADESSLTEGSVDHVAAMYFVSLIVVCVCVCVCMCACVQVGG